MTKKLLVQIKNEWRNNLWLALELLVVSVVMWFVVDYLYTRTATYLEPRGFDISHCYLIEMGKLTDKSPDYIPNQTDEQEDADILELVDRLRRRPEIEAVSLSQNSYPYNGSNSTDLVQYDTLVSGNWTIRRLVTPDFVRVFRYQGTRGETPEQLAGMLERGEFLASGFSAIRYKPTGWERPWRMYVTMISSRPAIRIPFFINSIGMIRDWNSVFVSAKIRTMISSNA